MKKRSDKESKALLRQQLMGLGEHSTRKSYYPESQQHLANLERFKALLDCSFDLIILVETSTGIIVDVNRTAREALGLPNDVICGMPFHSILQSEDKTFLKRHLKNNTAVTGSRINEHTVFVASSGDFIHVEVTLNNLDFHEEGWAE